MYEQILLSLVGVLLYLWYRQRKIRFQFFKKLGIPGPEPNILFGNFWDIFIKGPIESQKQWIKNHGKILGYYYGTTPVLLVTDVDLLKNILIKDFQKFTDRPTIFREISRAVNANDRRLKNLINLKGREWKDIRSLVTPTFSTGKMKLMSPIMNECIDTLMENIEEKRLVGKSFEIYGLFKRLTMDVIVKTAFGIQTNVQTTPNDPFLKLANLLFGAPFRFFFLLITSSFTIVYPLLQFIRNISGAAANKGYNPVEELLDRCEAIIKQRMNNPSLKRMDLLQLLIDAEVKQGDNINNDALAAGEESEKETVNNGDDTVINKDKKKRHLTIDQMVSNSFVFLLAGFETTSTALAFSVMMLVNYPDVQEKIRAEVNELLKKEGKLDYGSINQLQYLDQVFSEILRLYPPVYLFVHRKAIEDVSYDNVRIPKGTVIQVPTFLLHYDPDYWPEPQEFKPERFSPENRKKNNPLAWLPFGAGPRNCVGMRFAQMEAKMAIGKILHKYRLLATEETDKHPLRLSLAPAIIRPKYGVPIKVELA